jgi:hypothetical protein
MMVSDWVKDSKVKELSKLQIHSSSIPRDNEIGDHRYRILISLSAYRLAKTQAKTAGTCSIAHFTAPTPELWRSLKASDRCFNLLGMTSLHWNREGIPTLRPIETS